MYALLRGVVVLLLGLLLCSCGMIEIRKRGTPVFSESPCPPLPQKEVVRKEAMPSDAEGFSAEIARLKVIGAQDSDVAVRAKAHLQLARLYSDYRNPDLNYLRALQELDTYLDLDPESRDNDELQNWLAVLRELVRHDSESRRMERRIEVLTKENRTMKEQKEQVEQLEKKNKEMKEIIDKLQSIDIQIEERRRSIK